MTKALPYSPARRVGNLVFTAGQIGRDPGTGVTESGIEAQTKQTMANLRTHLENNGSSLNSVVKITAYLADMDDYAAFNDIYETYFEEPYPARTCVAVKELPRVGDVPLVVEVEAIATAE
jgi:2-iminobutanoate/2-iminopropanoate deaminase